MTKHDVPTKAKLNSGFIASLQPGTADYLVTDDEQRKLKLKVTPAGNKSFILRYRNQQGVERKLKLGDWPDLNTTVARKMAAEALLNVATGADPAAEHQSKRNGNTLHDVAHAFLQDYAALHLRPTTIAGYQSYLKSSGPLPRPQKASRGDHPARHHRCTAAQLGHAVSVQQACRVHPPPFQLRHRHRESTKGAKPDRWDQAAEGGPARKASIGGRAFLYRPENPSPALLVPRKRSCVRCNHLPVHDRLQKARSP